jgi:hypothetical protein
MVRDKPRASVEFGAKISVSVRNGFAFLHRISWDPYNESEDLIAQAKKYKQQNGFYPERVGADRIYLNTKNRNFCTRNNIRLSGKRLGRPPKDPKISAAHKQQLSADQRRRNEVEEYFGSGKRKYSLDLIMARLSKGAEALISMAFLVMCAENILKLLRLFFITVCAWFYLITQQAPQPAQPGRRVVHKYHPGYGPKCHSVPERALCARVSEALRNGVPV